VVANKVAAPAAFQGAWPVEAVQTRRPRWCRLARIGWPPMAASRLDPRAWWTLAAVCVPLFAVCVNTTRVRHPRHHHLWHRASSPSAIHAVVPPPEPLGQRAAP
jgi:hypothetical protein